MKFWIQETTSVKYSENQKDATRRCCIHMVQLKYVYTVYMECLGEHLGRFSPLLHRIMYLLPQNKFGNYMPLLLKKEEITCL